MEDYPQEKLSGNESGPGATGLSKLLRPISRTLRKRAKIFLPLGILSVASVAAIIWQNSNISLPQLWGKEEANKYCEKFLESPEDITLKNYQKCREYYACEEMRENPTQENVSAFLNLYKGVSVDSSCYKDALRNLDSLACQAARNAPDWAGSYRDYLKNFPNGKCADRFREELICESLRLENDCQKFTDYLDQYGDDGICSVMARNFIRDNPVKCQPYDQTPREECKLILEDYPCQILLERFFAGNLPEEETCLDSILVLLPENCMINCPEDIQGMNCEALNDFLEKYEAYRDFTPCYEEVRQRWKAKCEQPPPPPPPPPYDMKKVRVGVLWLMVENVNTVSRYSRTYEKAKDNRKYGRLYPWSDKSDICPKGWRLPCEQDWTYILNYYKSDPKRYLTAPDMLNLKFGGLINRPGEPPTNIGTSGYYWAMTEADDFNGWALEINLIDPKVELVRRPKTDQLSCRCVIEAENYLKNPELYKAGCYKRNNQ